MRFRIRLLSRLFKCLRIRWLLLVSILAPLNLLWKLGAKNIQAGRVWSWFWSWFWVGLAIKPGAVHKLQSFLVDAATKSMTRLGMSTNLIHRSSFPTSLQNGLGLFRGTTSRRNSLISCQLMSILHAKIPRGFRLFCTSFHHSHGLSWEATSQVVLSKKFELALKDHVVDEAWDVFTDFKRLYGFPSNVLLNRFVTELSYSSDARCLHKACELVHSGLKQNSNLFRSDVLSKLSLCLARSQLPEPASKILRLLLEKNDIPTIDVLRMVFMHMVKTEKGACLASNYLLQVCDRFLCFVEEKDNVLNRVKPDTLLFNVALDACVRFGMCLKGQELIEMMAKVNVVADADSIVIISCVYEMNGLRNELEKFRAHVDEVMSSQFVRHYQLFYDNLLSLHFKFDDNDSASELILDMCRDKDLLPARKLGLDSEKPKILSVGSHHIKSGFKIQIAPELLQKESLLRTKESLTELVDFRNGKLVPTNKALAKLVLGYKKHGKSSQLSNVLLLCGGPKLCADVVHSCINLGWLDFAHDILDDMELASAPMGLSTYKKLMSGYHKHNMNRNVEALKKQIRKIGLVTNGTVVLEDEDENNASNDLSDLLVLEVNEDKETSKMVCQLNTSVYYFCKAKMRGDASKTSRKMQEMRIGPTLQTFSFMIDLYSSLGMYREITILWGNIKRSIESGSLRVTRDLLEKLVMDFIRGGYFEKVMEVIGYMDQNTMFIDTMLYKSEFLKFHKALYRSLRVLDARNEAQTKRMEHVRAFRKLVGMA